MLDEIMFRHDPGACDKFRALFFVPVEKWNKGDAQFMTNCLFGVAADFLVAGNQDVFDVCCGGVGSYISATDRVCEWCYANNIDPLPLHEACLHITWYIDGIEEVPTLTQIGRMFDRAAWVARRLDPSFAMPKPLKERKLTRIMSVDDAARYLNDGRRPTNATTFLEGKYKAGVLTRPVGTGQNRRWIATEFPLSVQGEIQ